MSPWIEGETQPANRHRGIMASLHRVRLLLPLVVGVAVAGSVQGCRTCCVRHTPSPATAAANEVFQEFSHAGTQTAWRVRYAHDVGRGLYITYAAFRRAPTEPWIQVLYDARLSDIFVPYESGSPRYYDLSSFTFALVPATAADAGCCGRLLDRYVVREVRDAGVRWKNDQQVYRGRELVLWATLDAANYNYIIEYVFRDDGGIMFRLGGTAVNLPSRPLESHMHNGLWRIDLDLGGFLHDSALLFRHIEPPGGLTGTDISSPFGGGVEGGAQWEPTEFRELRIIDTRLRNGHGRSIGYDLRPLRNGSARHFEEFSHDDFYVTRYRASEMRYRDIDQYLTNESVVDTDVVLWHSASAHHQPRDEDGTSVSGLWHGSALVMWAGFELRPRNLFSGTPFYPD